MTCPDCPSSGARRHQLLWLVAAAFVATSLACASGELPPRAANDPSSPSATEMPPAPPPSAPAAAESGVAHDHAHHASAMSGDAGASFTCPMHPDVVQPAPGRCPKCGMDLVRKPGP